MLGIIGLIFVIVAPFFVYRSAKQNGHNPIFWMLLALGVGVGLQLILPLIIGIIIGIVMISQGHSEAEIQQVMQTPVAMAIGLVSLVLSVAGILLIMRRVNTVKDIPVSQPTPPTPPQFN